MEPGCLRDSLYHEIATMQAEIRELQRHELLLAVEIVALKKLVGATPVEVALATADRVVLTKFEVSVDFDRDEENDPYGKL